MYEISGRLLSSEGLKWGYMHNNVAKIMMNPIVSKVYCERCQ